MKTETIISKGIYFSIISSNKTELKYFLNELQKENIKLSGIVQKLIDNNKILEFEEDEITRIISDDNLDMFLLLFEKYNEKELALELLKKVYSSFKDNSKFLKTVGLLYFENNFLHEAADLFEESLVLKEKDPASLFYLISIYLQENRPEKIPALLIMAEKEFANIPEFSSKFEILKQKLSTIFIN